MHISFICISQGSAETHLWCDGICNNHIIAIIITLLQIVCRVCQWKNVENLSIIGKDIYRSKVPRFYGPLCIYCML